MNDLTRILLAKGSRVFVFGVVSVLTPVYLAALGFSTLYVYIGVSAMVAGSGVSNVLLARYQRRVGPGRFLAMFSLLMVASGVVLSVSTSYWVILFALFIGNVSTTGTESGPFQSVEAGVLPGFLPEKRLNRGIGVYNLVGYSASSLGALVASAPAYLQGSIYAFHGLYLLYGLVGLLLLTIYRPLRMVGAPKKGGPKGQDPSPQARRETFKLSALFSIDAFGGGFVSQSLLVAWFYTVYSVPLGGLGLIFMLTNVITAASTIGSSYLSDRIGSLRTMVYTHVISNMFLVLIPLAGSLAGALVFLFARQSLSQMDVPARQSFMAVLFSDSERVQAYATTNTSRIVSGVFGSPASGLLVGAGLVSIPLFVAGFSKIAYDTLIFLTYRKRA